MNSSYSDDQDPDNSGLDGIDVEDKASARRKPQKRRSHQDVARKSYSSEVTDVSIWQASPYSKYLKGSYVQTRNLKLFVEMGGDPKDPVILLISGLGAQMLMWPGGFCEHLIKQGFRVIRFDNRDIGLSEKIEPSSELEAGSGPPIPTPWQRVRMMSRFKLGLSNNRSSAAYSLFDMAHDVRDLMDALEIPKAHVIGCSMGGMIAQIFAASFPSRVQRLGLLSTSYNQPLSKPPLPRQMIALMRAPASTEQPELVEHTFNVLKQISAIKYFDEETIRQKAKQTIERSFYPQGVGRQLLAIFATGSLTVTTRSIKARTLVVHGSEDKVFSLQHGRALSKAIPRAKFVKIDDMGHQIPLALEGYLARLFSNFCQNLPVNLHLHETITHDPIELGHLSSTP